jgi:hypothetical protein
MRTQIIRVPGLSKSSNLLPFWGENLSRRQVDFEEIEAVKQSAEKWRKRKEAIATKEKSRNWV